MEDGLQDNMIKRKKTKKIKVGDLFIGGDAPISVQSMTKTDTRNVKATVEQIKELEKVGCEIIRVAAPDIEAAKALGEIKKQISIPLVVDVHFSPQIALEAINQGVDKLRINPGNIGSEEGVKSVVTAAKEKSIPIRIGVNGGSLEKDILSSYGKATAEAMVESAMRHIKILEKYDFKDIVISLKASDVKRTVDAYRLLSEKVDYPLHLGITEAGTSFRGTVLSSVGLGILLEEGIGDTLRVSLSAPPQEEVKVAWQILKSLEIRSRGVSITSCPTCGRTEIDLLKLVAKVEKATQDIDKNIHLAVMGCVVNGVGESKEADLAIIGGKGSGLIAKKGVVVKKVSEEKLFNEFMKELDKLI